MPPFNHLHPAIVHFPIALLLLLLGLAALLRTGHLGGHMVHDLHTHGGEP